VGQYTTTTVGFGFSIDTEVTDQIKSQFRRFRYSRFCCWCCYSFNKSILVLQHHSNQKINTDLAIIQNVSGVNFDYGKFDISASNQTLDLSGLAFQPDGYRVKAKWTWGDGNFQLSIVIPTGYTLGGVAKATIEADLKGDGQGVIQLVKNGTDLEIEKIRRYFGC
jgi:hypothetical protein